MNKKRTLFIVSLLFCFFIVSAQQVEKSSLQQRAETEDANHNVPGARSLFIQSFNDYASKGQVKPAIECAVKATALYYRDNLYQEAFDLLRRADQTIASSNQPGSRKSALYYLTYKERMQMYVRMRRSANAKDFLDKMERYANESGDEEVANDLLYSKTIYYYTFGMNTQGDAAFKQMAGKLTASKEYDKVEDAYKTLIANGRRSNSASIVANSYNGYMVWKDSVNALKVAEEIASLKQQIADNEASIAEKDSSLTTRKVIIVGLCSLVAALVAVLVIGGIILMRFIFVNRKQKKTIKEANDNNALKAKFISNISAQIEPTLRRLDGKLPEVKALLNFSAHVQQLSELENNADEPLELEETSLPPFCENLMNQIRDKVKGDVTLTVNAPKLSAKIYKPYVEHILLHLLNNAAQYAADGGTITLEYKKRSVHKHQFLVSDTVQVIPEEQRDDVFKPFLEIRDLTQGDGLGLPICKQMAHNMKGDLEIDPQFTKGTRFILDLYV